MREDCAQGPPDAVHGHPPLDPLPPGWSTVSRQETHQGLFGDQNFEVIGWPGKQLGSKPNRKLLELHEGEAQVQGHLVPAQAHQGDQDPVDHQPLQGVPEEPE